METLINYIIAPALTGFIGWFANAYRNKQKKEADQIEIAVQYKQLLTDALEDKRTLYQEVDKLRDELRLVREEIAGVKEERTLMKLAISKAAKCSYAPDCPVMQNLQITH